MFKTSKRIRLTLLTLICTLSFGAIANPWLEAVKQNDTPKLEELSKTNAAAFILVDDNGNNIWLVAARLGQLGVLRWLHQQKIPGRDAVNGAGGDIWDVAHANQQNAVLQWLAAIEQAEDIATLNMILKSSVMGFGSNSLE